MSSLHSALEMWTVLANRSVQEGKDRKVEFGHYYCLIWLFYDTLFSTGSEARNQSTSFFSHPLKTYSYAKT